MNKYLKYIRVVLYHKWRVFVHGRRLGLGYVQLLCHDLSKFLPSELVGYANHFYGGDSSGFDKANLKHHHRNPHHWQHWVKLVEGQHDDTLMAVLPIPDKYVREMVADWLALGDLYAPATEWYESRRYAIKLHYETRPLVEKLLYGKVLPS